MKRKLINIFICCAISISSNAQIDGYKFYAPLDSIKKSGFYNIVLLPTINAHLKTDYSDVRIVNAEGKWVPHALHLPSNEISREVVNWDLKYSVIANNKLNTVLKVNAQNLQLNNIVFGIRNTAAERFCSLSGSDDESNWFVINDSILINPIPTETKTLNTFRINFPLSSYKYYKIVIINSNKDPIEVNGITSVAISDESFFTNNKVIKNPITSIVQKDSGKVTYLKVTQQQAYHFDRISLKISGIKYYVRSLDIFEPVDENNSFANPGRVVQSYIFSNTSNLSFRLPIIKASVFYIHINNEDNLPLKVNEISTSLNERYIKTYLEKGNSYRLLMGNKIAVAPNYDIAKLNIGLKDSAAVLSVKDILAFPQEELKKNENNNKWILWTALIAGLIILLLLTKQMIKELNKKQANDNL